ncbi:hypothetical protein HNY73_006499 [Argiope bruennichi]|uniref:Uncharacterized protein n=1 Tax=Argiope bruennichi TaxID=94029 RepID=A0A8T0FDK1_ARGBR|nr:hypothetical protein HNY73_006499 [Argiope bruennichi]
MTKNEVICCTAKTEKLNVHQVSYTILLPISSAVETWNFERAIQTQCQVLPVSCNLQMTFRKMDENETILCSVALRRTDGLSPPVKVLIRIAFSGSTNPINSPKIWRRPEMRSGDEIRETVDEVVPFGDTSRLPDQNLTAKVSIYIMHCHSDRNLHLPAESLKLSANQKLAEVHKEAPFIISALVPPEEIMTLPVRDGVPPLGSGADTAT